jgi:hypothetical protein
LAVEPAKPASIALFLCLPIFFYLLISN